MDNTIDQEMIDELTKAYQYAYKYRMNTLRIRRLLSQSPITINNGQTLANAHTGKPILGQIIKWDNTLSEYPYISIGLLS